ESLSNQGVLCVGCNNFTNSVCNKKPVFVLWLRGGDLYNDSKCSIKFRVHLYSWLGTILHDGCILSDSDSDRLLCLQTVYIESQRVHAGWTRHRSMGDRTVCRSLGHVRVDADGSSGKYVQCRPVQCMDCNRSYSRGLCKLLDRGAKAACLLGSIERFDYASRLFRKQVQRQQSYT